jgi:hypothetical protein
MMQLPEEVKQNSEEYEKVLIYHINLLYIHNVYVYMHHINLLYV